MFLCGFLQAGVLEFERLLAAAVGAADLEIDRSLGLYRGRAAEGAALQHRRFQRQLRRPAGDHRLVARRGAGLVVDQRGATAREQVDAVGARAQREGIGDAQRNFQRAAALDQNFAREVAPPGVEFEEHVERGEDARPAQGAEGGVGEHGREALLRNAAQARLRRLEGLGEGAAETEILQHGMPDIADLARPHLRADGRQRRQFEDLAGINGVGVAPQRLDARHAEATRAQFEARARLRPGDRRRRVGLIEPAGEREIDRAARFQRLHRRFAGDRAHALQET